MINNTSIPKNTIISVLKYPDIDEAINWLIQYLGFSLRVKVGDHRAQMNVSSESFVITKAELESNHCNSIIIRVEEINNHYKQLKDLKVDITSDLTEYPFGEKQFSFRVFAGHVWTFSESMKDIQPEEWGGKSVNLT